MTSADNSDVWVIAFDGGCLRCGTLSRELVSVSNGKLVARDLGDEEVRVWRASTLGPGAPWLPTLLRVRGGKVDAWTGALLAARLALLLGPTRSREALKLLRKDQQLVGAVDPGRRRFLKTAAGTMFGAGALGSVAATEVQAKSQPQGPRSLHPTSQGSSMRQQRVRAIVLRSQEWRRSNAALASAGSKFHPDSTIVQASGGRYAAAYMTWLGRGRSLTATYVVDVAGGKVLYERRIDMMPGNRQRVEIAVHDNGDSSLDGYVDSDNGQVFLRNKHGVSIYRGSVDLQTGALVPAPGFGLVAVPSRGEGQVNTDLFGFDLCETAVTALCGTGGGAACYGVCVGLGFVAGAAGLACAAVCGTVAALGCAGAVNAICD